MLINKRLKERRKELGLTMKAVADIVGVSEATISRWETGDISNMRRDRIAMYAKALQIDTAEVMGIDTAPIKSNISEILPQNQIHMIPVFGSVSAGFGAYACSDIIEYIPLIITNIRDVDDTIGIKVQGNSMYPKIEDGDIIQVRRQADVLDGSVAVVMIGEEAVVKKVYFTKNGIKLHSFNPEYLDREITGTDLEDVRIVGLVQKVIKDL